MKIEDGSGTGKVAKVNAKQRLDVTASTLNQRALVSALDGQTYVWTTSFSAATGNEVIYIKNNSKTKLLFIDKIIMSSVNAGLFELYVATGTPGGTTITGANVNLTSNNVADVAAYGEAAVTGLTLGSRLSIVRTAANGSGTMDLQDILILGFDTAITLEYTGSTGLVDVSIEGYFEVEEDL
jgi:hypothetical protein